MPAWKRTLDILFGAAGVLLLVPLALIVGTMIRLDSPGPAFVKIKRISRGRPIHVWKFRTMTANAQALKLQLLHLNERSDGPFFKITNDPRVTRVGKLLRKSLLDEWPQFVNVLKGDLTLVGPRAHEPEEVTFYPPQFIHVPQAPAGLTGYSQINGASTLPFLKELEHDSWYLEHQSPWLDIKVILKTLWMIVSKPEGK